MKKKALALIAGLAVALPLMSACATRYAVSTSDTHVCVFDGSQRGGQKLKFQVPPGAASKHIDDNDQVVKIPASNRFYWVTLDDSLRDPGAPKTYTGNAAGGAPVYVEGQLRFRFNLAKACDWFSKHGRRNAKDGTDLGFNARGNPADVAQEGWFVYLRENFGAGMQQVVDGGLNTYLWDFLHYNYPVNADPNTGIVPAGQAIGEPTRDKLAADLGKKFTDRLNTSLGGDYFCGITPDPNGNAAACPPIDFEIKYAGPGPNSKLVQDRQQSSAGDVPRGKEGNEG